MFVRIKNVKGKKYLQVVENRYIKGKIKQKVICSLGNYEKLKKSGKLEGVIKSLLRFSSKLKFYEILEENKDIKIISIKKIGPDLVFKKLWEDLKLKEIFEKYSEKTNFSFNLERAIYSGSLLSLFSPSSDRMEHFLRREYEIEGASSLFLHHIYRAIFWLGKNKEEIEKEIFLRNRDLFTGLNLVFIDTTSIYFESQKKNFLREFGYSRDRRPFNLQVVIKIVIDSNSRPILCDILKGNFSDVKILVPTIEKLRNEFGVKDFCVVADRGMVCERVIREIEKMGIHYIFGFRVKSSSKKVRSEILRNVNFNELIKEKLYAGEIIYQNKRLIFCLNEEEKEREKLKREEIISFLKEKLKERPKDLIKDSYFKKYLKMGKGIFKIDREKIKEEEKLDGVYSLITNTDYPVKEVVLRYKELWQVESIFRDLKNVFKLRPVFHRTEEAIKGHIFVRFLSFVLFKELLKRMEKKGMEKLGIDRLKSEINSLYRVEILYKEDKKFVLNSPASGVVNEILSLMK